MCMNNTQYAYICRLWALQLKHLGRWDHSLSVCLYPSLHPLPSICVHQTVELHFVAFWCCLFSYFVVLYVVCCFILYFFLYHLLPVLWFVRTYNFRDFYVNECVAMIVSTCNIDVVRWVDGWVDDPSIDQSVGR
jgi:hypothetical protein